MSISPGTRFGPYEILTLIGAGGTGEVYRARDPKLNGDIAIQVHLDLTASDSARFLMSSLTSDSIADHHLDSRSSNGA